MNTSLYQWIRDKKHHAFRKTFDAQLSGDYSARHQNPRDRVADRFVQMIDAEEPVIPEGAQIVFIRTIKNIPPDFTGEEWEQIGRERYIHGIGYVSHLCPDYGRIIGMGLSEVRREADEAGVRMIDALLALCDRYRAEAARIGRQDIVEVLTQVPRHKARNLREALQFFRILYFALWLEGGYGHAIGRFDQYMYPYYRDDMAAGVYTEESIKELFDDFFLSFQYDADLYPEESSGEHGQNMTLGGQTSDGGYGFNDLSRLLLHTAARLCMAEPRMDLRVDKNTPTDVLVEGIKLSRAGVGFMQFSHDDVVIPALERLGYAHEDAVNYVIAAGSCFIIPGVGRDIPDMATLNFPLMVERAYRILPYAMDFTTFYESVRREIFKECDNICNTHDGVWFVPSPFLDLLMNDTAYQNYGIHAVGVTDAANALAAIQQHIFTDKDVSLDRLTEALKTNFADDPALFHLLRYETPKMGQDDDRVDALATRLLDDFAAALNGVRNSVGGIWRAGTGVPGCHAGFGAEIGADASGRRRGEALSDSFSPSPEAEICGPLAVIRSFTKPYIENTINGGPLVMNTDYELFPNAEGFEKTAELVRYFIYRGGHQLKLCVPGAKQGKDALLHPENGQNPGVCVRDWRALLDDLDARQQKWILTDENTEEDG